MARPLFGGLSGFLTFLCDTTLWQSIAVVWTTWNLDRMCARCSYLKLKNFVSKNFFNFFQKKIFFLKLFSQILFFPNFFLKKRIFSRNFFDFIVQKLSVTKYFLLLLRRIWRPGSIVYLSCFSGKTCWNFKRNLIE